MIWFVNQYAGSPSHGMEFRHYELGRQLVALGHRVVVISGSYSHLFTRLPVSRDTYTFEEVDGLSYCWVKVPAYRRATSAKRVWNMVVFMARLFALPTDRLPRPDAIVVSSPSPFPILPSERLARRWNARLIFEVRDLWPLTLRELGGLPRWHPAVLVMGWFERRAYRVADAVVSVLPAAGPYLEAHGVPTERLAIIPNGVGGVAFESAPRPPQVVTDAVAQGPFNVGFIGTLGMANALDTLIEAARLLADTDIGFVLIGHGSEMERLQGLASDLPRVVFVGPLPKRDVPSALRAFDVCYVGYHRNPLYRFGISPNKVFDYMAAARPVILAAEAANDPVAEAGCGLTIPPDDPAALADAILAIRALDGGERARLGANGRAFVERVHGYAELARRFLRVLGASTS